MFTLPENSTAETPKTKETLFIGKRVVITGGASGIGAALAKEFYKLGANLVKAFSDSHPNISVNTILLGPVRTHLFEKGKSPEIIERIAQNVGLYSPEEFSVELIDLLVAQFQSKSYENYAEIKMYKN